MGVNGLETFVTKTGAGSREVSIQQLINQHKSKSSEPPVIVVDSQSITVSLYQGLSWLNGGQLKEYKEKIENFINRFTRLGCHLVFFWDGPVTDQKLPTWKRRKYQETENVNKLLDLVNTGNFTSQQIEDNSSIFCFPQELNCIFKRVASQAPNCKVFESINECDDEVACYARDNKCLAILAQDTDYIIYNCTSVYLSMKTLDLDTMTAVSYSGTLLAKHLGLTFDELPLMASLVGNDYVSYHSLLGFHRGLRSQSEMYNKSLSTHKVYKVSEFIKKNRNLTLEDISYFALGDRNESYELLKESISGYNRPSVKDYPERYTSADENWRKILIQVKDEHIHSCWTSRLYSTVVLNQITSSGSMEDLRENTPYELTSEILKDLRQIIYGILLHEKPSTGEESNYVNEIIMTGPDSLNGVKVFPIYLMEIEHPGLLNLWNSNNEEVVEAKWDILSEIFKIPKSTLKNLPTRLLVPTICLKYLKRKAHIEDWEVDAILSSAICLVDYSTHDLSKIPCGKINYRSIWLYLLVTKTYVLVFNLIQYLGQPVSLDKILIDEYSDGKLFHMKYRLSRNLEESINTLCEHKVDHVKVFNHLKQVLDD